MASTLIYYGAITDTDAEYFDDNSTTIIPDSFFTLTVPTQYNYVGTQINSGKAIAFPLIVESESSVRKLTLSSITIPIQTTDIDETLSSITLSLYKLSIINNSFQYTDINTITSNSANLVANYSLNHITQRTGNKYLMAYTTNANPTPKIRFSIIESYYILIFKNNSSFNIIVPTTYDPNPTTDVNYLSTIQDNINNIYTPYTYTPIIYNYDANSNTMTSNSNSLSTNIITFSIGFNGNLDPLCFHENSIVLTNKGYILAKDINTDDLVYSTDKNEYVNIIKIEKFKNCNKLVKYNKYSLDIDSPNYDFYVSGSHCIKHNDIIYKAHNLTNNDTIKHVSFKNPVIIITFYTKNGDYINVNNMKVKTYKEGEKLYK